MRRGLLTLACHVVSGFMLMLMLLWLYSPVASTGLGGGYSAWFVMVSPSLEGLRVLWGVIPWACRVLGVGRTVRLMFQRAGRET